MENTIDENKMKQNISLYTKYKMFAYDVVFYYAVTILFLTTVKGFSMAEVMMISAFYSAASACWQIFSNLIVERIGLKYSIVLGNIMCVIMIMIYIFTDSFLILALSQIVSALGYSLKSISECTLLYESLKNIDKRDLFTKYEGNANSRYYYFEAIASIAAGYLFLVNPYIPSILTAITIIISLIMSLKFNHTKNESVKKVRITEYLLGIKTIFESKRSKSILLVTLVLSGITIVAATLYKAIIIDLGFKADFLAYIVCFYSLTIGLGSKIGHRIEKKLKNKTLTVLLYSFIVFLFFVGLIGVTQRLNVFNIVLGCICLIGMAFIFGMYRITIKKYVISFTNSKVRTKISSLYYMFENMGSSILAFVASLLMTYYTNSLSCIIICLIILVLGSLSLIYAKDKLGLKPEEYEQKDINYIEV